MRKIIMLCAACAPLLLLSGGSVAATEVFVNEDYVELRSDKGGWSDPVATLNKGAALEVLEGEDDESTSYYRVRIASGEQKGVEGYIDKSLVARQKPDDDDWGQMAGYFGGSEASSEGDVAGAKGGFGDQYARAYGYNLAPVFAMDEVRRQITREDIHAFMRQGGVGVYQPKRGAGGEK